MRILVHHRVASRDGQAVHLEELVTALRGGGHETILVGPPRLLVSGVGSSSNSEIDDVLQSAIDAGAQAGKISGAGGGGFVTFLVSPERRVDVIRALSRHDGRVMTCHVTRHGTEGWKIL